MGRLVGAGLAVSLMLLLATGIALAYAPTYLSENWDGYTSGSTPYGRNNDIDWELKNGDWMSLDTGVVHGGTQSYDIGDGQTSQISYAVDFDAVFSGNAALSHIAVQGWFYDGGAGATSFLGLGNHDNVNTGNGLVRIGAYDSAKYVVQYGDFLGASPGIRTVDTGFAVGEGWHFARFDLVENQGSWLCHWWLGNEDLSQLKWGSFPCPFDRHAATRVVLGSDWATGAPVAWDDIKVGPLGFVGEPPVVPEPASAVALGLGVVGLLGLARKRKARYPYPSHAASTLAAGLRTGG